MARVDDLIETIMAQIRARPDSRVFSPGRTYADEPIVRRASQMTGYLPGPVRELRALERLPEARRWGEARLFVEQARLVADFDDDCPTTADFDGTQPTYHAMTDRQLRGYLTWRAQVRRGTVPEACDGYVLVRAAELLNGVGATPGGPAARALADLAASCGAWAPAAAAKVEKWLLDYVVWHGLDPALAGAAAHGAHDRAIAVVARHEARVLAQLPPGRQRRTPHPFGADPEGARELTAALDELGTYRLRQGRLWKERPDDVERVAEAVFARLVRYYRSGRSHGLTETLVGPRFPASHLMFSGAPVWIGAPHADATYELDEVTTFECAGGHWTCTSYHDGGARSAKLGQVLHCLDCRLREALGYAHPLKARKYPKYLDQIVQREVSDYLAWKEVHEPRPVAIDLSKLAGIRAAAATTRESLLVDEEREEGDEVGAATDPAEVGPPGPPPSPVAPPAAPPAEAGALGLTADELAFVAALLAGEGAPAGARADLVVDSVNEKAYDLVGDTVIEFGADGAPALVEDYADDLREALGL